MFMTVKYFNSPTSILFWIYSYFELYFWVICVVFLSLNLIWELFYNSHDFKYSKICSIYIFKSACIK